MEDLHTFETECTLFDKNNATFGEAVAQFESVKELGISIIMNSGSPKR